uniref:Putative secreted protein n=1 Tax=Xenopsylla cheopis TaxID=163159 RepID=A0A6M2DWG8_XENCH
MAIGLSFVCLNPCLSSPKTFNCQTLASSIYILYIIFTNHQLRCFQFVQFPQLPRKYVEGHSHIPLKFSPICPIRLQQYGSEGHYHPTISDQYENG